MRYDEQRSAWMVFGYAEVQQVLLDTDTFSSERTLKAGGSVDEILGAGMLGLDPPRHRHLRSLVVQAFTQKRVTALEPRILALTVSLIDRMQDREVVDIVDALAFPLPVMVIAELLGIPTGDRERFRSWSTDIVGADYELRVQGFRKMGSYFDAVVTEHIRNPQENLISELLDRGSWGRAVEQGRYRRNPPLIVGSGPRDNDHVDRQRAMVLRGASRRLGRSVDAPRNAANGHRGGAPISLGTALVAEGG
jgi:cytochrome P450